MPASRRRYKDIDEYIAACAASTQRALGSVRAAIRKAAPHATESINYGIPPFQLGGNLVHYAAFYRHIGFYPTPSGIRAFRKKPARYASARARCSSRWMGRCRWA